MGGNVTTVLKPDVKSDTNPTSDAKPEFKAAVGLSRKWEAREAGREVAADTLSKLGHGVKPDFFLLFTTIHYEKHGGFKEFLAGVWDVLPKDTPLIGGTVAGFINPQGCYTRGATALAVNYPNMDIAVGIGKDTRRNPEKAAKELSTGLRESFDNSRYSRNLLFTLLPGGTIPSFFGIGRKKVLKNSALAKLSLSLLDLSIKFMQMGPGREEEVFESLAEHLSSGYIIGGSTTDDLHQSSCYQFYGNSVYSTHVVGLNIKSNLKVDILTSYGLKGTGKTLSITKKGLRDCVILEFDHKPATGEFLKQLKWPKDFLD
ncbi:MAG: FIST N-terminal domain-containing protein, partial [Candidatus Altiarchaeota archaeon]